MKKLLSVLFASLVLLTACSSNTGGNSAANTGNSAGTNAGTSGGKQEITIWAWDPAFNIAALEVAKETYAAKNPNVTVNIVEYAQSDIVQKMNTGLNAGTTNGLPNIVLIEDYRAKSFLQSYPDAFYDLSNSIKASDFVDYKIGPTSQDGKQYGVPFDTGSSGLYIRTDYLEQASYTLKDVQDIDWNQMIEIGKKVKGVTGKNLITQDPNDLGFIRMLTQSAGLWYFNEDGTTPNLKGNAALKESFQVYKALVDADLMQFHSDWSQFVGTFNKGDVVTVPTGNWITPSVKAEASQSGKWAVVPLPKLPNVPNAGHASNLGGSSWYVLNVDGKEAAADFLAQTFGSDVPMYEKLVKDIGAIGTLKSAYDTEAYKSANEFFGGQAIVSDFAKWAEEIPKVNYGVHTYAIDDILVVEMQNYLSGKDIDKVLSDAQATAEAQVK